jgi:hypothetical protein
LGDVLSPPEASACGDVEHCIGQFLRGTLQIGERKINLRKPLTAGTDILADFATIVFRRDQGDQVLQIAVDEQIAVPWRQRRATVSSIASREIIQGASAGCRSSG